jgi:hypothetical protein
MAHDALALPDKCFERFIKVNAISSVRLRQGFGRRFPIKTHL